MSQLKMSGLSSTRLLSRSPINMAHKTPLSGHMGVTKTCQKIVNHFYWPSQRKDVVEFCKSCHACQMVGKLNQTIPKSSLQPIHAVQEPFSRIMVDCVGPLPKTRSGNQYLLTIMLASTRFPEAIPGGGGGGTAIYGPYGYVLL